jgi:hypothetical protein
MWEASGQHPWRHSPQHQRKHLVRAEGFDCEAYVREHLGKLTPRWQIETALSASAAPQ